MDVVQDKMTLAVCEQDIEFLVNVLAETLDIYYSYSTRLELILHAAEAQDAEVAHRLQSFQLADDSSHAKEGHDSRARKEKTARRRGQEKLSKSSKKAGEEEDGSGGQKKKKKKIKNGDKAPGVGSPHSENEFDASSASSEAETEEGADGDEDSASSHSAESASQTDGLEEEDGRGSQLGDDVNRLGMAARKCCGAPVERVIVVVVVVAVVLLFVEG